MKLVHYLAIIVVAVLPPVVLLTYDWSTSGQSVEQADQGRAQSGDLEHYRQQLENGFAAYQDAYEEELEAHRQQVVKQWGEYKEASPSVWLSYEGSGEVRRTVDFEVGKVQVELIVDSGTPPGQVNSRLDQVVYRLMNSTEKTAFEADVVASRVEQRLSEFGNVLQKAEMSEERLFPLNDLVSLTINHDGYLRVSANTRNVAVTDVRPAAKQGKDIVRVSFSIPHTLHQKAARYAAAVTAAAAKEKIDDELIFAIMETESSFNPMAKSHVPAYGLMQIVPRTAGRDATNYLFGKAKILAPSYLYKPENNITIGAAYLHVLHYRYMRRVKNEESRMYCAIAAYNTGASNVARAFIDRASFNRAIPEINKLSPQQVFEKLKKYLPRQETRAYIEKVSRRMEKYR